MPGLTREDLLALATRFRDAAAAELALAETADQLFAATLHAHARLNALQEEMFEEFRVKVDCKAGCGTCCFLGKIDARAHDVLALANWIDRNFSPEDRAAVLARAQAHAAAVSGLSLEQHLRTVRACPLLKDMKCSAHPGRASACRIGHSTSVAVCQRAYENPDDLSAANATHAETKLAMTVAADGTAFAFLEQGFDKNVYDLGSALAEALADQAPLERWLRGEQTFSDLALAKQQRAA
jgi:Fe-S-cluster containining protein